MHKNSGNPFLWLQRHERSKDSEKANSLSFSLFSQLAMGIMMAEGINQSPTNICEFSTVLQGKLLSFLGKRLLSDKYSTFSQN
jgi:hypothetical protein